MNANEYLSMFFGDAQTITPLFVAGAMVLSFLLSMIFAIVYQYTFRGFTYSRSYIHSMVLGSMVTCMLIMAVGNNLARGMGILGTLAIIRFRTPLRDPRDSMFLFSCLGVGIACGCRMPLVAVTGALVALVAVCLAARLRGVAALRDENGRQRGRGETAKHPYPILRVILRVGGPGRGSGRDGGVFVSDPVARPVIPAGHC